MLLVFIKAIAPLAIGQQCHSVNEQALHIPIVFHERYFALTDIAKFSHVTPLSLSQGATDKNLIVGGFMAETPVILITLSTK